MSLDFERVKDIDDDSICLVFGYLRKSFSEDITDLIAYICLLFYAIIPIFGKRSQHLLEAGLNSVEGDGHGDWCSAFGYRWINSTVKKSIKWKIETSPGQFRGNYFGIGIISNHHKQDVNVYAKGDHSYIFCPYYSATYKGRFFVNGAETKAVDQLHREVVACDVIHLILDLESTALSYYLNNEESSIKVLTNGIKTAEEIKYAFVLTLVPSGYGVSGKITVTEEKLSIEH